MSRTGCSARKSCDGCVPRKAAIRSWTGRLPSVANAARCVRSASYASNFPCGALGSPLASASAHITEVSVGLLIAIASHRFRTKCVLLGVSSLRGDLPRKVAQTQRHTAAFVRQVEYHGVGLRLSQSARRALARPGSIR